MLRDLKADLELCNKATPGLWRVSGDINHLVFAENSCSGEPMALIADCGQLHHADTKEHVMEMQANAAFIAAAREGWPEAIERAIKAEEELEKQQQLFTAQTDRNVEIIKRLNERKREVCEANDLLSAQVAGYRNILKVIHAGCTPFLKTSDLAKDIAYACYKALSNPDPGADLLAKIAKLEAVAEAAKEYLEADGSITAQRLFEALAALEGPADE